MTKGMKKILTTAAAAFILTACGVGALAAGAAANHTAASPNFTGGFAVTFDQSAEDGKVYSWFGMGELTDEQKADMEARRAEMEANLTDEQKAEMEARMAEMETRMAEMEAARAARDETWNALTDEQKEELYALYDAKIDAEIAIVQKQLSLGLLSEDEAAAQIARLEENKAAFRENGIWGGMVKRGGGLGCGRKGGMMKGGWNEDGFSSPDNTTATRNLPATGKGI